jgi:hypothetical protein
MGNKSARRGRNTARKSRRNQKGGSWKEARQRCLDFAKKEESESEMVGTVLSECEDYQYKVIEEEEARRKAKAKAEAEAEAKAAAAETETAAAKTETEEETGGKRRRSSRRRRRGRKTARKSRRNQKGGNDKSILTDEQNDELEAIDKRVYEDIMKRQEEECDGIPGSGYTSCVDDKKPEAKAAATKARNEAFAKMVVEAKAKAEAETGGKRRRSSRRRRRGRKTARKGRKSARKSRRRSRR